MPRFHKSTPGEERYYRALPLPGPTLVIDVRSGDDMQLLQYLTAELEDLTREMYRKQVPQWRYLAQFIKFLKIELLGQDIEGDSASGFVVRPRTRGKLNHPGGFRVRTCNGKSEHIQTKDELAWHIIEYYLLPVRKNRINAYHDYDDETVAFDEEASVEQSTVRVFFLIDLNEEETFTEAASYATWFNEWNIVENGPPRLWRDVQIETVAICMNVAPHRHNSLLEQKESITAFDKLILMQSYRDDNSYMDEEAQTYQAELMLYTLLLHWPMSMERVIEDAVSDTLEGIHTLQRPTYTIGISAFENSTRWGARWLDYGLAAEIIKILCDSTSRQKEEKPLQIEAEMHLNKWWQRLQELVRDKLTTILPNLQALDDIQRLMTSADFRRSASESLLKNLVVFCKQVSQLYTGTSGATLQLAYESANLIPAQLKQAYLQAVLDGEEIDTPVAEAYHELSDLHEQSRLFMLDLFKDASGALPRALQQLSALTKSISAIEQMKQNPPDLKKYRKEFEHQAEEAHRYIEDVLRVRRWPFLGRKEIQREAEMIYDELEEMIQKHLAKVHEAIAATVALTLLEWAGLYDLAGKQSSYQERVQSLNKLLNAALLEATDLQSMSYERLSMNRGETAISSSQTPVWRNLNNRRDLLKWDTIKEFFLQSYKDLHLDTELLASLAKMLLQHLGASTSHLNGYGHHNGQNKTKPLTFTKVEDEFQALNTELVAVLLTTKIEENDFTGVLPLLDQYAQMRQRLLASPALDSEFLDLQDTLKEAMLEQVLQGTTDIDVARKRNISAAFVLAGWVRSQHAARPQLEQALDSRRLLAYISDSKNNLPQLFKELGKWNKLASFPDEIAGEEYYYLLLPPGDESYTFLEALDLTQAAHIQPVLFPDTEKLIYLHVHRIRQIQTFSSADTEQ